MSANRITTKSPEVRDWWIYKITNPKGRVYIGVTSNIRSRIKNYKQKDCKSQPLIYKSIEKYGFSSHSIDIIDHFTSNALFALGKELFWIKSYMSNVAKYPELNNMNVTDGGFGALGKKMSDETKQKLRLANLGKKASESTKHLLSQLRRGRKINRVYSEEEKRKMSNLKKGFKHTEETKKKIGEASLGNKYRVGKKHTDEWRIKMSERIKGNNFRVGCKLSDEHKLAISKANSKKIK